MTAAAADAPPAPPVDLVKRPPVVPGVELRGFGRWSMRRRTATLLLVVVLVLAAGLGVAGSQLRRVSALQRLQVTELAPATAASAELRTDLLGEQTAAVGFALTGSQDDLARLRALQDDESVRRDVLASAVRSPAMAAALAGLVSAAQEWRDGFVTPLSGSANGAGPSLEQVQRGRQLFGVVEQRLGEVSAAVDVRRSQVRGQLTDGISRLEYSLAVMTALLLLALAVAWVLVRMWLTDPLERVTVDVRAVADGDLGRDVRATGASEVRQLAGAVESMRQRIAVEVDVARDAEVRIARSARSLRERNADLARSNAELEQFAYVASHDLQEPLRKIASFCQLLERRYGTVLDETGRRYIAFAVDGSKRMQVIINDLLTFSRTGRSTEEFVPVDLGEAASTAVAAVDMALRASGGRVEVPDRWPTVPGQPGLLALLLQNLVANALKFRCDGVAPVVVLEARTEMVDGEPWARVAVTDNGIGIEPQFADKVFALFQRLHARDAYEGTGIGLALCRKVVEFHGGRIWLDVDHPGPGARFELLLPEREGHQPRRRDDDAALPTP